jgi:hypothetical protein
MQSVFLTAEWRKLILVNYVIDPSILQKYIPPHTQLDLWNGNCYLSIVGFLFKNTKIKGIKFPFHINFEEVNLRFYVIYTNNGITKRGAVFISEIVPKPAISIIANTLYNEKYQTLKTKYSWEETNTDLKIMYGLKKQNWYTISVVADKRKQTIQPNSEAEFITEHYWGYTKKSDQKTIEYGVEHPRWEIYAIKNYDIAIDFEKVYGNEFAFLKQQQPTSVILAEGSEVLIRTGKIITN